MKNNIPDAKDFITMNAHLTNEQMLIKFAKLHVLEALEECYKISNLEAWDKNKIYECYPQTNIK